MFRRPDHARFDLRPFAPSPSQRRSEQLFRNSPLAPGKSGTPGRSSTILGGKLKNLLVHIGIPVVAAVAAGLAAGFAANAWPKPGRSRVLVEMLAAALLAALVATELTSASIRHWLAARPVTTTTASGLLLIVIAVTLIEAAVGKIFTSAEEQKSRAAAKAGAAILMTEVSASILEFQRTALWRATVAIDSFEDPNPDADAEAARLAGALTRAVLDTAGILTATSTLYVLYEHSVAAAAAARDLPDAIRDWTHSHAESLSLPTLESESARLAWWSGVMRTWDRVVGEMTAFQVAAERELELDSDAQYAWTAPGPTEYEKARHAYLNEYG